MGSPEGEEGCCVKNRNHIDLKSSDRLFILNTSAVFVRPQLHLGQDGASFCNCKSQYEKKKTWTHGGRVVSPWWRPVAGT